MNNSCDNPISLFAQSNKRKHKSKRPSAQIQKTYADNIKIRHQQKIKENHKNTFILIETLSLMLWLHALSCEPAHRQSTQPHHQSFQDSIKMKEKTRFR